MKNKFVIIKQKIFKFLRNLPFVIYIVFSVAFIVLFIVLLGILVSRMNSIADDNSSTKATLLVGIVAAIISSVLCFNSILTIIINKIYHYKQGINFKNEKVSKYIKDFNGEILKDLNLVSNIIKRTEKDIGYQKNFVPVLTNQKDLMGDYQNYLQLSGKSHIESLLYSCAIVLYPSNYYCDNKNMTSFLEDVIKSKTSSTVKISNLVKTIGGSGVISTFNYLRIRVLNFFENMAMDYANNALSEDLINLQFKEILLKICSSFYYYIYTNEGVNSYPYLNVMLQKMQSNN